MSSYMEELLDAPLREVLQKMHVGTRGELNRYHGIRTMRSPMDSWVYQQIIWETRPDVLIEIGNKWGGSALMFSHIFNNMELDTRIIGVDLRHEILNEKTRAIPNSVWIEGDAIEMYSHVAALIKPGEKVMIMEDSAHTYDVTLAILNEYHGLVTPGQYFVIEDGIMNHGLKKRDPAFNAYKACEDFAKNHPEFEIDRARELFVITYNPKGYLRRV